MAEKAGSRSDEGETSKTGESFKIEKSVKESDFVKTEQKCEILKQIFRAYFSSNGQMTVNT